MEIRTKAEFFRLWEAGVLGNKLRTWRDPNEAVISGVPLVGFRQIGAAGGGRFQLVENAHILDAALKWTLDGLSFMVCEAAPDQHAMLQGEVCRLLGGWHGALGINMQGIRMRDAMARGLLKPCRGVQVVDLLNRFMDVNSREDLEGLLELYPDATVEFTCYRYEVGCLPARNTIFWEVRNY